MRQHTLTDGGMHAGHAFRSVKTQIRKRSITNMAALKTTCKPQAVCSTAALRTKHKVSTSGQGAQDHRCRLVLSQCQAWWPLMAKGCNHHGLAAAVTPTTPKLWRQARQQWLSSMRPQTRQACHASARSISMSQLARSSMHRLLQAWRSPVAPGAGPLQVPPAAAMCLKLSYYLCR